MTDAAALWMDTLLLDEQHDVAQSRNGVLWCDSTLAGRPVRYVALIPHPNDAFPRARHGEAGILQGWTLAQCLRDTKDAASPESRRAVVALVDVPSQAYGRREEALCLSLALAAAVDAYAALRARGHAVVSLIVGNAMSGGLLAHGYQSGTLLALDHPAVHIQAMSMAAALRVTRRDAAEWRQAAESIPPIGYDLHSFRKLGILDEAIACSDRSSPGSEDVARVKTRLAEAIAEAAHNGKILPPRINGEGGSTLRKLSLQVREAMYAQWESGE